RTVLAMPAIRRRERALPRGANGPALGPQIAVSFTSPLTLFQGKPYCARARRAARCTARIVLGVGEQKEVLKPCPRIPGGDRADREPPTSPARERRFIRP